MSFAPSDHFVKSVLANIAYWQNRTREINADAIKGMKGEHQNLIRAIQFGLELPDSWRDAANLLLQCYMLIDNAWYGGPWIPLLEQALERCQDQDIDLKCQLLDRLGCCHRLDRNYEKAEAIHRQEERLAVMLGDKLRIAYVYVNYSHLFFWLRRYDEAEKYGRMALSLFEEVNAPTLTRASATATLGMIARGLGNYDQASELLLQAIALWRQVDNPVALARSYLNLGTVQIESNHREQALDNLSQAKALLDQTDSELDKVHVQISLGTLYYYQNDYQASERAYDKANSPFLRRSGHPYYQALVANNLGNLYLAVGRLDEAENHLLTAIRLWRTAGASLMLANTLGTLADTLAAKQRREGIVLLYEEAISICREHPDDAWGRSMIQKFEQALSEMDGAKQQPAGEEIPARQ